MGDAGQRKDWRMYIHMDGGVYYYNAKYKFITTDNIHYPSILRELAILRREFFETMQEKGRFLPGVELCTFSVEGDGACSILFRYETNTTYDWDEGSESPARFALHFGRRRLKNADSDAAAASGKRFLCVHTGSSVGAHAR